MTIISGNYSSRMS